MKRRVAASLVERYVSSWLERDRDAFLSCLHEQATVRECNGNVFRGRGQLGSWFVEWNAEGNRVDSWTIDSLGFDSRQATAFAEWRFACTWRKVGYAWYGASIVRFRGGLIVEIDEYERKEERQG